MNRRSFFGSLAKGAASFLILPGAGRVWRPIPPSVCAPVMVPPTIRINVLTPSEILALYGIKVENITVPGIGVVRIPRSTHIGDTILSASIVNPDGTFNRENPAIKDFIRDYESVGGKMPA